MNSEELNKDSESCWAMTNVSLKTKTNRINSKGCKGKIGYQVMKFTTEDHEEKDDGKRMVEPDSMDVPRVRVVLQNKNLHLISKIHVQNYFRLCPRQGCQAQLTELLNTKL